MEFLDLPDLLRHYASLEGVGEDVAAAEFAAADALELFRIALHFAAEILAGNPELGQTREQVLGTLMEIAEDTYTTIRSNQTGPSAAHNATYPTSDIMEARRG